MHDYHEGLPGYSKRQILHDGCGECEHRSELPDHGLNALDRGQFAAAWLRAAEWQAFGLIDLSYAETPLLDALRIVRAKLAERGIDLDPLLGAGW